MNKKIISKKYKTKRKQKSSKRIRKISKKKTKIKRKKRNNHYVYYNGLNGIERSWYLLANKKKK